MKAAASEAVPGVGSSAVIKHAGLSLRKLRLLFSTCCKITSFQLDYTVQDVIVFKGERKEVPRGLKQRLVGEPHASYHGTQGYLLSGPHGMQGTHQGGPGQPREKSRTATRKVHFNHWRSPGQPPGTPRTAQGTSRADFTAEPSVLGCAMV